MVELDLGHLEEAAPNLETDAATQYGRSMTGDSMTPPGDVYPGPLRRFLAAVAADPDPLDKWWPEGPGRAKGKYNHLWIKLSPEQQIALQSRNLDEIARVVHEEATKFPKPGEEVDSANGLAWALVRV